MRTRTWVPALVCLAVAMGGCLPQAYVEPTADDTAMTEADVAAIEAVFERYGATVGEGDAEGWYSLFADETVLMLPDGRYVAGVDGVREWAQHYFDDYDMEESNTVTEIRMVGDWAYARGDWSGITTPKAGGDTAANRGSFAALLERDADGTWKLARFIWTMVEADAETGAEAEAEGGA